MTWIGCCGRSACKVADLLRRAGGITPGKFHVRHPGRSQQFAVLVQRRAFGAPIVHFGLTILAPIEHPQTGEQFRSGKVADESLRIVAGIHTQHFERMRANLEEVLSWCRG
jgi:hypothetical protein